MIVPQRGMGLPRLWLKKIEPVSRLVAVFDDAVRVDPGQRLDAPAADRLLPADAVQAHLFSACDLPVHAAEQHPSLVGL